MTILQAAALGATWLLAIFGACMAGFLIYVATIDKIVATLRFHEVLIAYLRDRQGAIRARTIVEQKEEMKRTEGQNLAEIDRLRGRLNLMTLLFGKLMWPGYDASLGRDRAMLEDDVARRMAELGIPAGIDQPMVNFREDDYRAIAFAHATDRIPDVPMRAQAAFQRMRFDLDEHGRIVREDEGARA